MIEKLMEGLTRKGIMCGYIIHSLMGKREPSKKLDHPWSGPYRVVKKLSEANYRIEQLQGRRTRKIVHFDRLKPCPKNIRLNQEHQSDLEAPASNRLCNPELPVSPPFGKNLQIVDDDNITGRTLEDCAEETATTSSISSTSRYPRREHRAPS